MSQQYLSPKSLKHFDCPTSEDLCWYNLSTSRKVRKLDERVRIESPRITAKIDDIELIFQFLLLNRLTFDDLTASKETIAQLKDVEHHQKKAPSHISKGDVDSIDLATLDALPEFTFSRMWLKARITNVVDGDTVDAAIEVPLEGLMCASGRQICLVVGKGHPLMIIKQRLRLYALDTAEKDTIEGQLAKKFSIGIYQETNNKIEILMLGTGARGRALALIYPRSDKKKKSKKPPSLVKSINERILEYNPDTTEDGKIKLGKLAVPYYGKTKLEAFTKSHHLLKNHPEFKVE